MFPFRLFPQVFLGSACPVHPVCPMLLEPVLFHTKLISHTLESGLLYQLQSFPCVPDCTSSS